MQVIN